MSLNAYAQILDPETSTPRRFDLLMGEARSLWGQAESLLKAGKREDDHNLGRKVLPAWKLARFGLNTLILLENGDLREAFEGRFAPRAHTFYGRWLTEFRARGGNLIMKAVRDAGLYPDRLEVSPAGLQKWTAWLLDLRRLLGPPPWRMDCWASTGPWGFPQAALLKRPEGGGSPETLLMYSFLPQGEAEWWVRLTHPPINEASRKRAVRSMGPPKKVWTPSPSGLAFQSWDPSRVYWDANRVGSHEGAACWGAKVMIRWGLLFWPPSLEVEGHPPDWQNLPFQISAYETRVVRVAEGELNPER
jgi:hypothetical protein